MQARWDYELSAADFVHQFGKEHAEVPKVADDAGYAIYDVIRYPQIPPQMKVTAPLFFPIPDDQHFVIAQFRDVLQRNHLQIAWFTSACLAVCQSGSSRGYAQTGKTEAFGRLPERDAIGPRGPGG